MTKILVVTLLLGLVSHPICFASQCSLGAAKDEVSVAALDQATETVSDEIASESKEAKAE